MEKTLSKLNQTTLFQNEYKAEVKLISDTIYKNLHVLGYLPKAKPTDDFKNIFSPVTKIHTKNHQFYFLQYYLY